MGAGGLARQLGIERGEANEYVKRYFERYPGVREFMERTREQAHRDGYVETLFGRRLYLIEIHSPAGVWLTVRENPSSRVVARESSSVVARESSIVVARESSRVMARESSRAGRAGIGRSLARCAARRRAAGFG